MHARRYADYVREVLEHTGSPRCFTDGPWCSRWPTYYGIVSLGWVRYEDLTPETALAIINTVVERGGTYDKPCWSRLWNDQTRKWRPLTEDEMARLPHPLSHQGLAYDWSADRIYIVDRATHPDCGL